MNELEQLMQTVQIYIYQQTGRKVRIYLRNLADINKLKQAHEFILNKQNNKNTKI